MNTVVEEAKEYIFKKSDKSEKSPEEMVEFWADWVETYPIISIEDGMGEQDWDGWKLMTDRLASKIQLVGGDLFVTHTKTLKEGIEREVCNDTCRRYWRNQNSIGNIFS